MKTNQTDKAAARPLKIVSPEHAALVAVAEAAKEYTEAQADPLKGRANLARERLLVALGSLDAVRGESEGGK